MLFVVCNLSEENRMFDTEYALQQGEVVLANYENGKEVHNHLRPYEARLYKLK